MSSDQSDDGQEAQRLQVHDTDYENVEQNGAQDLPAEDDGLQSFSHSQAVAPHLDGTPALPNDKTSVGQHAENESESEGPDAVRKSGQEAPGTCMDLDQPTVLPYSEPVSLPSDHVHDRIKALEEDGVGEINELASAAESRKISIQEFECELQVYQENAAATMGRLPAKVQGAGNGKLDEELQATEFHIEMQQSRIRVLQEELRAMQAREKAAGETKGEVVGEGEDKRSEHGDAEPEGKGEVACADVAKALGRRDPASLSDWAIVDAETFSLNNLKEEISNLKQQLEDALQACQVMQVDIKSKEGDIKACESDLELSKARVVELEGEVSAHREGPQDSLKQGANVENDKIAPEAHEPAMHETLAACQADLKSSICKCTALEGENVSLQEQLKKSEELCRYVFESQWRTEQEPSLEFTGFPFTPSPLAPLLATR